MTVMVDDLRVWDHAKHRCFKSGSAHLTTDAESLDELHEFAARLGLKRAWFQNHFIAPHYDLSPAKHVLALQLGSKYVSALDQARARRAKRGGRSAWASQPSGTDKERNDAQGTRSEAHASARAGAMGDSPVIIEGNVEEDVTALEGDLVQAVLDDVEVERRCEDGPPGIYLNVTGVTIG